MKLKTPPGPPPQCVYHMIGLIELSNYAVQTVSLKCTIPSVTEGKGEVKVKMYGKCIEKMFYWIFSNEATVGFKFDVRQSCRARWALSLNLRLFLNPSVSSEKN